jgi:membrane fusion protein, multidrug efflux system
VTLGPAIGELRVIREGLKPGDEIVVSGLQKVKPGDPVTPVQSAKPITTAELSALTPVS